MKATAILHDKGQSLWLDNLSRGLLESGQLARYLRDFSVTGLTSNPTIFETALRTGAYDADLQGHGRGAPPEELFTRLAIADLQRAADLFRPIHERTDGVDGWVSIEVSPLLAHDAKGTIAAARALHARAARPNLFVKIPGTAEGCTAIEESIAAGIPINVTLLFSVEQYQASAEAYLRGLERRIAAGLSPRVASVASVFVSRWDKAANPRLPDPLKNKLGLAVGRASYRAYRQLMNSERWQRLLNQGARAQRLLYGSTSAKEPGLSPTFYVEGLFAPFTINTMPDKTLEALFERTEIGAAMPADGGDCDAQIARVAAAGVDVGALAGKLQDEGAEAFTRSWNALLQQVERTAGK